MNTETITVETVIDAPVEKVWTCYTDPAHIIAWNNASPDWHTPKAENDLRVGGRFLSRMEARDGSAGFDFTGTYTNVVPHKIISYTMDGADARAATSTFSAEGATTRVSVTFDIEHENPAELQRGGWQSILDSFKEHVESEQ